MAFSSLVSSPLCSSHKAFEHPLKITVKVYHVFTVSYTVAISLLSALHTYRSCIATYVCTVVIVMSYLYYYIIGVPNMVPNVTVVANSLMINDNNVTLTLSWGEPFNNLDPIARYIVSCSSVRCPPNFTMVTTGNTTRSYTITNLTRVTNYTFSVVAVNSVGKGKAGVVMISTPGEVTVATVDTAGCNIKLVL